MRRIASAALLLCTVLPAADKKPPQGRVEDESVSIAATILDAEHIRQAIGDDFNGQYTVLEVRVTPKGGMPLDVRLDNFILRSESDGDHSAPLIAGQIAGSGELVVKRKYAAKSSPGNPNLIEGTTVEVKDAPAQDGVLEALKKNILVEKVTADPVSGWLFFPLEKEKPKNLVLSCTTPKGKLRMQFK
jgi:hypothetical protein